MRSRTLISPAIGRGRVLLFLGILLVCLSSVLWRTGEVAAADRVATRTVDHQQEIPVHSYRLDPEIECRIFRNGSVRLNFVDIDQGEDLLECIIVQSRSRRPDPSRDMIFTAIQHDGVTGGLRGFTPSADDDQDGSRDEDYLDGRDNDDDGLIDEDFAAISDEMVAIHRIQSGADLHLETYHWEYGNLGSCVMLECVSREQSGGHLPGEVVVKTTAGFWRQTRIGCHTHSASGPIVFQHTESYVTTLPDPMDQAQSIWLGVLVLADPESSYRSRGSADQGVEVFDGQLELQIPVDGARIAMTVGRSFARVNCNLTAALATYSGVRDQITNQHVHWIVPPICPLCRSNPEADARLIHDQIHGWRLILDVAEGTNCVFDPERFFLSGISLGTPNTVTWTEYGGQPVVVQWSGNSFDRLDDSWIGNPYGGMPDLLSHRKGGSLEFTFYELPLDRLYGTALELKGYGLNGRPYTAEIDMPGINFFTTIESNDIETINNDIFTSQLLGNCKPTLSPQLLDNYPNPFRGSTSVRFVVPETIADGFIWIDLNDSGNVQQTPPGLDMNEKIPYRSSPPNTSVRVYSLGGQELVTLHEGPLQPGRYEAAWDGTDGFGSPVASGTYFCKFQVDSWSVTKRLVFLR